jgi:hypothetical protein
VEDVHAGCSKVPDVCLGDENQEIFRTEGYGFYYKGQQQVQQPSEMCLQTFRLCHPVEVSPRPTEQPSLIMNSSPVKCSSLMRSSKCLDSHGIIMIKEEDPHPVHCR